MRSVRDSGSQVLRSYVKTTIVSLVSIPVALLLAGLALYWLPLLVGLVVAVPAVLGAVTLSCAGLLVMHRHGRSTRGERDLFLELNRSREPDALRSATAPRVSRLRRWLARHVLGHDFVVGDLVEIKPWAEIRATLDERGCLDQLPFMPEMLAMCGRRARVFRCAHRLFDYRKTRKMRHMGSGVLLVGAICDGSNHGGCDAACHTIWKSAWLHRVERSESAADATLRSKGADPMRDTAILQTGCQGPHYACQLTQLNAASRPIGNWSAANFLRPLISGNVTPAAFVVGRLTALFNEVQHLRGGDGFPAFGVAAHDECLNGDTQLRPGDQVIVRSPAGIRATLNDRLIHRGMGFEPDMLKHCGHRYRVQDEVKKLIDIVTGELRTMKTPAYILRDVHFSGERQLFNAQYEPLFWRSIWLQKDSGHVLASRRKPSPVSDDGSRRQRFPASKDFQP